MFNYVFHTGSDIGTFEGKTKEIVCKWKDAKVKGDRLCNATLVVLGLLNVAIGVNALMEFGFRKGCRSFEQAEYDVMTELGLFTDEK